MYKPIEQHQFTASTGLHAKKKSRKNDKEFLIYKYIWKLNVLKRLIRIDMKLLHALIPFILEKSSKDLK